MLLVKDHTRSFAVCVLQKKHRRKREITEVLVVQRECLTFAW